MGLMGAASQSLNLISDIAGATRVLFTCREYLVKLSCIGSCFKSLQVFHLLLYVLRKLWKTKFVNETEG